MIQRQIFSPPGPEPGCVAKGGPAGEGAFGHGRRGLGCGRRAKISLSPSSFIARPNSVKGGFGLILCGVQTPARRGPGRSNPGPPKPRQPPLESRATYRQIQRRHRSRSLITSVFIRQVYPNPPKEDAFIETKECHFYRDTINGIEIEGTIRIEGASLNKNLRLCSTFLITQQHHHHLITSSPGNRYPCGSAHPRSQSWHRRCWHGFALPSNPIPRHRRTAPFHQR